MTYQQFNFLTPINTSCQVGDMLYWLKTITGVGGFATGVTEDLVPLGQVKMIGVNSVTIAIEVVPTELVIGSYILFAKNKMINTSSLVGYFAEAKFVNNSNKKIELFSVSSEVVESSK